MSETIRIPFTPMPHTMLLSVCRAAEKPDEAALLAAIEAFITTHMRGPLQACLHEYIKFGGGALQVVDVAHNEQVRQTLTHVRSLSGEADPLRLDGVKWCVIIGAQGVMVPPVMHIWFARIAACVLHAQYGEPVCDAVSLLADPRYVDPQAVANATGTIHLAKHLRLLASADEASQQVQITSLGMSDFGLPDVAFACPQDAAGAAQLLTVAVAQYVLKHAMGAMQHIDETNAEHEQTLELPMDIEITREILDQAMGVAALEDPGSRWLQISFRPGDDTRFAAIEVSAA